MGADGAPASRTVVIEGPAGIGKSRLIAELRDRATAHGVPILVANGSDLERDFPFGVVRQLFDPSPRPPRPPRGCSTARPRPPGRCSRR